MKKLILFAVLCLILIGVGCSTGETDTAKTDKDLIESRKVIENYFKYYNEKNKEGVLSTLTEWHHGPNVAWNFDNLEYIRIISLQEETNPLHKAGYLNNGRGSINGVRAENVRVYRVTYEAKYQKDSLCL